ncbi:MAG: hypothetical protein ACRENV_02200 [Candidatus Dormibacteria bacterium]
MTTDEEMQAILRRVAAGELSPEQGAVEIEALQQRRLTVAEPPVSRVRVVGAMHPLRIIGDGEIKDAVVTVGPHRALRRDDTLEIHTTGAGEDAGFTFGWPGRPGFAGFGSAHPERALRPIQIRMNPDLALEVEMAAGLLSVQQVRGPIKAEIQAGSAKLDGFASAFDLNVTWGTVSATGVLQEGDSRIRCEAGTVKVVLEPGSSVKVVAKSTLGRISLPGEPAGLAEGWTMGGDERQATVGEGAGRLLVETTTGAVWVEEA